MSKASQLPRTIANGRSETNPGPIYPLAREIVNSARLVAPRRTAQPSYMKEINLLIVLDAFRAAGTSSRAAVARATGISPPTASKSVQQLVEAGLLVEDGRDAGTIGKPATRIRFNAAYGAVLGIDLGGTHLRLAVSDLSGRIRGRSIEAIDPEVAPDAILARISQVGSRLLGEANQSLMAIGLATPGIVNAEAGTVVTARNLKGWRDVPIGRMLEDAFGVPAVVENDVNAAALGERWHGAARGHDSFLFVSIGTGVGAGLILDGEIYRGTHFAAGEISLLPVGVPGDAAFLEDRGSGPGIVRRALELGFVGPADGRTTTDGVFAAAASGDEAARRAVEDGVNAIAFGTGVLMAAMDPSIVVLGGGVTTQGDAILRPVAEAIGNVVRLRCEVVLSELGIDAQLHGAVFVGLKRADVALVDRVRTRVNE